MARRIALLFLVLLLGASVVATDFGLILTDQAVAEAQPKKKNRPGIFERLFGPRDRAPPKKSVSPRSSSPSKQRRSSSSSSSRKSTSSSRSSTTRKAPTVKTVEVEAKDPNARKILVIGDFVGSGIATGLDQALAEERRLAVIESTKDSSGLVRTDVYDWNKELLGILNEENPDIVVVSLGANDRQDLRVDKERYPVRSEPWQAAVEGRVDGMIDTLKVYGRPFFWVSAPPLRGEDAMSDIAYLNGLVEPRITKAGGFFVDIWNGFTNASGQYITTGPDIEGQVKALRTSDGVGFTSVGKQKLAYYVERDIRRQTGIGAGTVDLLPSVSQTSTIVIGPDGKKRLVGPVISLSDPLPGVVGTLAGAPAPVTFDPISGKVINEPTAETSDAVQPTETAQYRLVVRGDSLPSAPGRVDDFAWPPSQRSNQAFLSPEAQAALAADAAAEDGTDAEAVEAN